MKFMKDSLFFCHDLELHLNRVEKKNQMSETRTMKSWLESNFPHWPAHRHHAISNVTSTLLQLFQQEIVPSPLLVDENKNRFVDWNAVVAQFTTQFNPMLYCFH